MEKRIVLMSYKRLTKLVQEVTDPALLKKIDIYNCLFQEALVIVEKLISQNKIDVIIAGGSMYDFLKSNIKFFPVTKIDISGYDLIDAIRKGLNITNNLAILSYKNGLPWYKNFAEAFCGKVSHYTYEEKNKLESILNTLKNQGYGCVLGTSIVCEVAEKVGINSIFLYSKLSVVSSLKKAIEIQESLQKEQERSQQLSLILDLIPSGIMAIDSSEEITLFNPAASRLTGIFSPKTNKKEIDKIIIATQLKNIIKTGKEEREQFHVMPNGTTVLAEQVPIKIQGRVVGALATFNAIEEISDTEKRIRQNFHKKGLVAKHTFDSIVGSSKPLQEAKALAQIYAKEEGAVLITGETGTGKELFAQSIHNESCRKKEPFVAINCAALPENLLESELFGYEGGAFTGARKGGKIGLLELGHRGTIFLDEVSSMSSSVQSRLLRVLEEKEIMRVGSDKVVRLDIRVIAASNLSLTDKVIMGNFREDLFYRLNVLHIELPPLRERKEDFLELLTAIALAEDKQHLYIKYKDKFHSALILLSDHSWPGNVREFKNILHRLYFAFENNLNVEHVFKDLLKYKEISISKEKRENEEDNDLINALESASWNRSAAAKILGISRTTLWRRLKKFSTKKNK